MRRIIVWLLLSFPCSKPPTLALVASHSGTLDAKKAAQLGAKGKQLGQLKNGEDVKLVSQPILCSGRVRSAHLRKLCAHGDADRRTAV